MGKQNQNIYVDFDTSQVLHNLEKSRYDAGLFRSYTALKFRLAEWRGSLTRELKHHIVTMQSILFNEHGPSQPPQKRGARRSEFALFKIYAVLFTLLFLLKF